MFESCLKAPNFSVVAVVLIPVLGLEKQGVAESEQMEFLASECNSKLESHLVHTDFQGFG